MTSDAAFWTNVAPKYSKRPIPDMKAYEATLDRVRSYLSPTDRVIEFGAGTGGTGVKLAPHVASYLVTDFAEGMIQIADQRKADAGLDMISTDVGVIADFKEANVNVALAFNLFHLVPDMKADFADIFEMLPKGGLFIQKTPGIAKMWYLKLVIYLMALVGKAPKTMSFFKPEDVDAALIEVGFEIVETGFYPEKSQNRFIVARKPGL